MTPQGCRRLKQQKCSLSQLWSPEVRNQGVSRAVAPPKAPGKGSSWPCQLLGVAVRPWRPLACRPSLPPFLL